MSRFKTDFKRISQCCLLSLATLLAGCTTTPQRIQPELLSDTALTKRAEESTARGNIVIAAQSHLQLARRSSGAEKAQHQIAAATILARGGYIGEVKKIIAQIKPSQLTVEQQFQQQLLRARIALQEQQPKQALNILASSNTNTMPAAIISNWYQLRAEAFHLNRNYIESIKARILLEPYINDPIELQRNHQQIWQTLAQLSGSALLTLRSHNAPDALNGWLELAYFAKISEGKPSQFEMQSGQWQVRYPTHPAQGDFLQSLLMAKGAQINRPENIALLLPLSGQFSGPAAAVRDGFMAAYYSRPNSRYAPRIKIFDTSDDLDKGLEAYQQAITTDTDFIVGPLHKPLLEAIANKNEFPVPTLALNYLATESLISAENLFQYGLLPEDEARQVAERAWLDGHNNAIVLTPEGEWGERMQTTFQQHWEQLGGSVIETQNYDPNKHDFSAPVIDLLNVDQSQNRHHALKTLFSSEIKFEPRRRQDVDFIFVASFPRQARQIRPQLKFYYAANLPVYSTSHVFSGKKDSSSDRDMDGIIFCDMPWVFTDGKGHEPKWSDFTQAWKTTATPYKRLYAMGIDAYMLITKLDQLRNNPEQHINAETGNLYLDDTNRIHRQLLWAKFNRGQPRLIESAAAVNNEL